MGVVARWQATTLTVVVVGEASDGGCLPCMQVLCACERRRRKIEDEEKRKEI